MNAAPEKARLEDLPKQSESTFDWEWRVFVVSAWYALPGTLCGALVRLCVPDGGPVGWWLAGGATVAATFGGLLEADHILG